MSRTEKLARCMYAAYRIWNESENGPVTPMWQQLRKDTRDEYLKLAEHLTLEGR